MFEILSKHPDKQDFMGGEDVYIILVLTKPQELTNGSVLYEAHAELQKPRSGCQRLDAREADGLKVLAAQDLRQPVCTLFGRALILQVWYEGRTEKDGAFSDTFIFDGNRLLKIGYLGKDIAWAEELHKIK